MEGTKAILSQYEQMRVKVTAVETGNLGLDFHIQYFFKITFYLLHVRF